MGLVAEILPDAGAPQVGLTVTGLDGVAPSTISLDWSHDAGATWHGVRGAQEVTVLGGTFKRDHVPPLNVEATYRLTVHTGATIPSPLEDVLTVPSASAWIQDPLAPRTAVEVAVVRSGDGVLLLSPSAGALARHQPVDLVMVEAASMPVASVGTRQAPSGVAVHLRAIAASQGALIASLRALFDTSGQLVLRGLPVDIPMDPVAHIVAPDLVESAVVGGRLGLRNDWVLTATQTRPTSLRIVVPWWTYDQVKALWSASTYAAVAAARPGETYLDWLRDPEVP